MEGRVILAWLEQALGVMLMFLVLLDVFLTVLYARAGAGVISHRLAFVVWRFFLGVSKNAGRQRGDVLSFCGPVILVTLLLVWALALTCGAALIIHPHLGASVTKSSGSTPTDFITALFAGASSMSVVGSGDFSPQTSTFRLFYLFTSLVGMSVISLTISYLLQVYTGLQRRNAFGLNLHLSTAETGDAAEVIAGIGPQGQFEAGYSDLSELGATVGEVKEAHHFYPILFYFRFREPYYSVSRAALVSLDTATLIKSALDEDAYGWFMHSGAVGHLSRASLLLVTTLEETFLPGGVPTQQAPPDPATRERWRRRYFAALRRLQTAGIKTIADEHAGVERYIELRGGWDQHITTLAPSLAYTMEDIDPVGNHPDSA